jgi:hypothetical protein
LGHAQSGRNVTRTIERCKQASVISVFTGLVLTGQFSLVLILEKAQDHVVQGLATSSSRAEDILTSRIDRFDGRSCGARGH